MKAIEKRLNRLEHPQGGARFAPLPRLVDGPELAARFGGDRPRARRHYAGREVHFDWNSFVNCFV